MKSRITKRIIPIQDLMSNRSLTEDYEYGHKNAERAQQKHVSHTIREYSSRNFYKKKIVLYGLSLSDLRKRSPGKT